MNSVQMIEMILDVCVKRFPRHTVYKIARELGTLLYWARLRRLMLNTSQAIQKSLAVQKKEADKIALQGILNICTFLVDYQYFAIKSDEQVFALANTVEIDGLNTFQALLESQRPLIFVSIHMDSFLISFLKLCQFTPKNRPITVVKLHPLRKKEINAYKKFNQLGAHLSVVRLSDKPAIEVLKALRNGNIVIVLCDVAPALAKTVEVSFLGKLAHFSSGMIELAISAKAMLVPLVSMRDEYSIREKHTLKIENPIDPLNYEASQFSEKTQIMTQDLARVVESWIYKSPSQWQSWAVLPSMWSKK